MIQYISKPFKYFFKLESASGLVLLFAAVIALFISNSSLGENYFKILESYFTLGTEDFGLKLSVLHWINDVLMAIFFFLVSLEFKREFVKGSYLKLNALSRTFAKRLIHKLTKFSVSTGYHRKK